MKKIVLSSLFLLTGGCSLLPQVPAVVGGSPSPTPAATPTQVPISAKIEDIIIASAQPGAVPPQPQPTPTYPVPVPQPTIPPTIATQPNPAPPIATAPIQTNARIVCEIPGMTSAAFRQGPGLSSPVIAGLPCNTPVRAIGDVITQDGISWVSAEWNGRPGWIAQNLVAGSD